MDWNIVHTFVASIFRKLSTTYRMYLSFCHHDLLCDTFKRQNI